MKFNFKLIALLLALMLAFAAFVGCNTEEPADETTAAIIEETEAPETEPSAPTEFELITAGTSNVRLVRPADLPTDDMSVKVAIEIRKIINNTTDVSPELADDWIKDGQSYDSSTLEILFGATGYPETAEAIKDLAYGEYTIKAIGNKIVVFSYTDSGYTKAMNTLTSLIRSPLSTVGSIL